MKRLTVGVFGLQDDIEEHIAITRLALTRMGLDGDVIWAKISKNGLDQFPRRSANEG